MSSPYIARDESNLAPIALIVILFFGLLGFGTWWLSTLETGHPILSQQEYRQSHLATPFKSSSSQSSTAY